MWDFFRKIWKMHRKSTIYRRFFGKVKFAGFQCLRSWSDFCAVQKNLCVEHSALSKATTQQNRLGNSGEKKNHQG